MDIRVELLKLVVQLAGALVVARLAVRWALNRYKSEKLWERKLDVYAEVLAALSELHRIDHKRFHDVLLNIDESEGDLSSDNELYSEARRKLMETIAKGELVLDSEACDHLAYIRAGLSGVQYGETYSEMIDRRIAFNNNATAELIKLGRRELGFPPMHRGG